MKLYLFTIDAGWRGGGVFIAPNVTEAYSIYKSNCDRFYFDIMTDEQFREQVTCTEIVSGIWLNFVGDY
jgi:hypothetical protein